MNKIKLSPLALAGLALIALLNLALAGDVWARFSAGDSSPEQARRSWTPPILDLPAPSEPRPLAEYVQTIERPVFFKSRQPWKAPDAKTAPPSPAPAASAIENEIALSAIAVTPNAKKVFVTTKTNPRGVWVSEGDVIEQWTVTSIDQAGASFARGARSGRLNLYVDAKAEPAGH